MAGEVGIEPTTGWLTVNWSTTDLLAKNFSRLSIFNPSAKRILISAIDCILGIFTYETIGFPIRTRTATKSFGDSYATITPSGNNHKLVRPLGLEPRTYWLKASYSTIELWSRNGGSAEIRTQNNWVRASYDAQFHHKPIIKIWRSHWGSNPDSSPWKGGDLAD